MPWQGAGRNERYVLGIAGGGTAIAGGASGRGGRTVRIARAPTGLQRRGAYFLARAMFAAAR
jgi:hypothetical protein